LVKLANAKNEKFDNKRIRKTGYRMTSRILIVEDNELSLRLLSKTISEQGYEIEVVTSGEKALFCFAQSDFDLVLLDLELPGMNGLEVLKRIKTGEKNTQIPVIVLTAITSEEKVIESLQLGATDFVTKPYSEIQLLLKIRNQLKLIEANRQLQTQLIEHQKLQQQLITAQNDLQTIIDNSPVIMLIVDKKLKLKRINKTGSLLIEKDSASIMNQLCGEVFNCLQLISCPMGCGNTNYCNACEVRNAVKYTLDTTNPVFKKEGQLSVRLAGEDVILYFYISTVIISIENQDHVLLTLDDITKRVFAEIGLKESERKYRSIIENMNDTFWIQDLKGTILDINSIGCSLLKENQNELIGMNISELYSKSTREELNGIYQTISDVGSAVFDADLMMGKFKRIPVNINAKLISTEGDGIIHAFVRDISERKLFERKLKESEKSFRQLFENIKEIVALVSLDGKVIFVNDALSKVTGLDKEKFNIQLLLSYIHHEDRNSIAELFENPSNPLKEGKDFYTVYRFRHPDGQMRWIDFKAYPVFDEENNLYRIVIISDDITQRINAERKLQEQEFKLRIIFENSSVGIMLMESLEKPLYCNPRFLEITGYTFDEYCALPYMANIHPDDRSAFYELGLILYKGDISSFQLEKKIILKNGELKWIRVNITAVRNENKEILYIISVIEDINKLKKAEFALIQSEMKFSAIAESALDGILLMDRDGSISYANHAVQGILGYQAQEITQMNIHSIINLPGFTSLINLAFDSWQQSNESEKEGNISEFKIKRRDGSEIYIDLAVSSVKLNRLWHAVGIVRDITHRKLTEKQLRQLNATKDKLFSIIAHDLRNPFHTILGFSELLMNNAYKYNAEKIHKLASGLNSVGTNAYNLLENLLNWSKIQNGKLNSEPKLLNFNLLLDNVLLLMNEIAAKKNINILKDLCQDDLIFADEEMIKTVLRNLISNAIKFSGSESQILISTHKHSDNFKVEVIDYGVGIAPENMEKLFHLESSYTSIGTADEKGSGLGLMLCKEFIEKNNGNMLVESILGQGSTFGFILPVKEQLIS